MLDPQLVADPPLPSYRADIQGLRAVAVLLVVASHLNIPWLAGGYMGVDIFFVISGYLISSSILPQIRSGTFLLSEFYGRRVRRIFPALVVMLTATIPFAWHFLFPNELTAYARSLLAAVFACSNMLRWSWGGYFDKANELWPLLHTWSLGVEEQFYLIFPLLMMGIVRLRRPGMIRASILGLTAISFGLACILAPRHPHAAFFNISLRAWELLAGVILSQHYLPSLRSSVARNLAGLGGLLCIGLPAFFYSANTTFPGLAAVPPCLGAALLMSAGESGSFLLGRLLSLRPFTFFGLISYSLYLWHWPVLVFVNLRHLQTRAPLSCDVPIQHSSQVAIFALSILLATISWRFVEMPFRGIAGSSYRSQMAMTCGLAAGGVAAVAIGIIHTQGASFRYPPDVALAASQLDFDTYVPWRWGSCALGLDHTSVEMYDQQRCLPFTPGRQHYLLLGDSHAAHLWPGISTVFGNLEIGQANVAGCDLLTDRLLDRGDTCREMADFVYGDLLRNGRVNTLIVSALWHEGDMPAIGRLATLAHTLHIKVILIGPSVAYDLPLPRLLGNLAATGSDPGLVQAHANPNLSHLDAQMATLAREQWKVSYISFFADVCSVKFGCPAYASPGVPMLLDTNHLTPAGAIRFARSMHDRHQLE